jgi:hypothetical protein
MSYCYCFKTLLSNSVRKVPERLKRRKKTESEKTALVDDITLLSGKILNATSKPQVYHKPKYKEKS